MRQVVREREAGVLPSRSGRRATWQRWGIAAAAALGMFHLLCPFSIGVVQGSSMTPTYQPGQWFILDRHYYDDHPIRRGDVVVVRSDDHTMIKRVFGVGGDSIWLLVQSDGDRVDRFVVEADMLPRLRRAAKNWGIGHLTRLTVPSRSVYLLGDCVEFSIDSRAFGAVPTSDIVGKVTPWRPGAGAVAVRTGGGLARWDGDATRGAPPHP